MATKSENALVDLASEDSFPASDPPSYMGGVAIAGPPPRGAVEREPVSRGLVDPDQAVPELPPDPLGGRSAPDS